MAQLVKFEGADGSFMWVEVSAPPTGSGEVALVADESGGRVVAKLEDSLESVRGAWSALMGTVAGMTRSPEEVTLELALSFAVEGGVIVAKGSAKAEASVTLTWKAGTP